MGKFHKLKHKQANSREQAITVPWREKSVTRVVGHRSAVASLEPSRSAGSPWGPTAPAGQPSTPGQPGHRDGLSLAQDMHPQVAWVSRIMNRTVGSWRATLLQHHWGRAWWIWGDWNRVLGHRQTVLGKSEQGEQFTELRVAWGWRGLLEVILFNLLLRHGHL